MEEYDRYELARFSLSPTANHDTTSTTLLPPQPLTKKNEILPQMMHNQNIHRISASRINKSPLFESFFNTKNNTKSKFGYTAHQPLRVIIITS